MISTEFSAILAERFALVDNDAWGLEAVWKKEIELLTRNLDETIVYVSNECTDEQLVWMSEVFEEIVHVTHCVAFLDCLKNRVTKVEDAGYRTEIQKEIEFAEDYLD